MSSPSWLKALTFGLLGYFLNFLGKLLGVMGDRAVEIHGLGNGKGAPYYILGAVLVLASIIAYFMALRHSWQIIKAGWGKGPRP
jgi:hypothetical protein